jgi:predicted transcriptional regulator
MTVVSRKFATNRRKYYDPALNEQMFVQRNNRMFTVANANVDQQVCLEPDDDLRRAITIDELREKIHKRIHKLFAVNESISNSVRG